MDPYYDNLCSCGKKKIVISFYALIASKCRFCVSFVEWAHIEKGVVKNLYSLSNSQFVSYEDVITAACVYHFKSCNCYKSINTFEILFTPCTHMINLKIKTCK